MTMLPCPLRTAARRDPEAPALVDAQGILRYAQFDAQVDAAAAVLRARGCGGGTRVALRVAPDRSAVVLLMAALRAQSAVCLLNRRIPDALLRAQLAQLQPCGLVTDEAVDLDLPGVWCAPPEAIVADAPTIRATAGEVQDLPADAPATLIFTSGSTATPKIAVHSLRNHLASAAASNRFHGLAASDRWLLSLPIYHVGGLAILFRCLVAGASVALADHGEALAAAVARLGVTHLSLVPAQLGRLLEQPDVCEPRLLKCVLLGGAPAPDTLVREALARGWPVRKTYGMTEMSSQVTAVPPAAPAAQQLSAGRLLDEIALRFAEDGEILLRGPSRFLGYWENGGVVSPPTVEGWLATGDCGWLDEAGYLRVTGRKDNLFISGGENIQPEEIEAVLQALPGVARAVVVPVADARFGQRPVACMRMDAGEPDGAALALALARQLPRYKIPIAFLRLPAEAEAGALKVSRAFCRAWVQGQFPGGEGAA